MISVENGVGVNANQEQTSPIKQTNMTPKIVIIENEVSNAKHLMEIAVNAQAKGDKVVMFYGRTTGKTSALLDILMANQTLTTKKSKKKKSKHQPKHIHINIEGVVSEKDLKDIEKFVKESNNIPGFFGSINSKRKEFGTSPLPSIDDLKEKECMEGKITLSQSEIQSGLDRVSWAERLICLLPKGDDGRNSWLLNYGVGVEANMLRSNQDLFLDPKTRSAINKSKRNE